jgi:2-polyprenyl-6-methoxyphenol hydroxylase-like FAD-dependent oxidoreductase
VNAHAFSRDLLEWSLRQRVTKLPQVTIRDRSRAKGLRWNADVTRVTGVQLADGQYADADLVVDASGRYSRLPDWLEEADYPRPAQTVVDADLAYATMLFDAPDRDFEGLQQMNSAPTGPAGLSSLTWRAAVGSSPYSAREGTIRLPTSRAGGSSPRA